MKRRQPTDKELLFKDLIEGNGAPSGGAKRAPVKRPYRSITYRDQTFFVVEVKDQIVIYSWNARTNKPEYQITVPKSQARMAIQQLARIFIAEETLNRLETN